MDKQYNFEMTLNPPVVEMFKDNFMLFLEMEILQGEVTELPDGQTKFSMNVSDEKAQIIKAAIIEMIAKQNYNAN